MLNRWINILIFVLFFIFIHWFVDLLFTLVLLPLYLSIPIPLFYHYSACTCSSTWILIVLPFYFFSSSLHFYSNTATANLCVTRLIWMQIIVLFIYQFLPRHCFTYTVIHPVEPSHTPRRPLTPNITEQRSYSVSTLHIRTRFSW